jgi:hypothetical protein
LIRALEWFLERSPERGFAVRGLDPNRFASWVTHAKGLSIQVIYEFDDARVTLLSARIVPSKTFGGSDPN